MNRAKTAIAACVVSALPLAAAREIAPGCEERIVTVGGPCLDGTATSRGGELPVSSREILGFRLGEHSFEDAQRLFGKGRRWHSGDAAASEEKLCYVARDDEQQATLVLSANAEMSARGTIDGMTLIAGSTVFAARCPLMASRRPVEVKTSSGIHLGMSLPQMKAVLGPPTEVRGDYVFYTYCSEKNLTPSDPAYEQCKVGNSSVVSRCSGLTARFEDNRLRWVEFGYGTDYVC
jgi:hypothetical protein